MWHRRIAPFVGALDSFMDTDGIILVGGWLQNAVLSFDATHSMLLAPKGRLTKLLFQWQHQELSHCGPQALLCNLRQRFWSLRGTK